MENVEVTLVFAKTALVVWTFQMIRVLNVLVSTGLMELFVNSVSGHERHSLFYKEL